MSKILPEIRSFFSGILKGKPDISDNDELTQQVANSLAFYIARNPEDGKKILADLMLNIASLQRQNKILEEHCETDSLTGAKNRRCFDRLVEQFDESAKHPERRPTGRHFMAMIDLDGFKGINDVFGHAAGDEALKTVVKNIQDMVRRSDIICRVGGDEFVIVLKNSTPEGAQRKIEKIRTAFETMGFLYDGVNILVKATIAHGEVDPDPNRLTHQILEEINRKMYEFKMAKGDSRYAVRTESALAPYTKQDTFADFAL